MKIRLNEIPQEGRSYTYDRESGELDEALQDLIGEADYRVEFTIMPIGNAYEMRGELKTTLPEICSCCGYDFELSVQKKIKEILFEDLDEDRKAQSVRGNQSVNFLADGPAMTPYKGDVFDPAVFVHESIALAEPFYPMCGGGSNCLHREEVEEIKRKLQAEADAAVAESDIHPAFAVLKNLELEPKA